MKRKQVKSIREYNEYLNSLDKNNNKDSDKCPHGEEESECTLCISELVNRSMCVVC